MSSEPSAEMRRLVDGMISAYRSYPEDVGAGECLRLRETVFAAIAEVEQRAEKAEGKLALVWAWREQAGPIQGGSEVHESEWDELDTIIGVLEADAQKGAGDE